MSKYGISEKSYKLLINSFSKLNEIEEVILFGSRAIGNYKKGSDIDIAIKGKNVNFDTITKLSTTINQKLNIPYYVDIVNFNTIDNNNLKQHIKTIGISIYMAKKLKTYINGATSLSPQNSLDYNEFLKGIIEYEDDFLKSIKPNYKEYMKPIEARRMSKTVKNGIICSQKAMQEAEVDMPDAIIVGTGLGIVSDTEKFLEKMLNDNEQYLTPTSFIQSTHNTVAAQVALRIKCHNYNFTYVSRGFSFETALQDGMMHLNEGKKNILIGGADEMSEHYFHIIKKNGRWKKSPIKNTELLNYKTEGAICGEGVNFFVLSSEKKKNTYAEFKGLKTFYKPKNDKEINNKLVTFLEDVNFIINNIDLVITGHSGDKEGDAIYNNFLNNNSIEKPVAYFKHLTGDYQTASSFALWLGANILRSQKIPDFIMLNNKKPKEVKNILIYNHYFNINHSFMLLSAI